MEVLQRIAKYCDWGFLALITILSAARSTTPTAYTEPIRSLLQFLTDWAFPLIVYFAIGGIATKAAQEVVQRRLAKKEQVKHILDCIHKTYFRDQPAQEHYQHRVTLFKACKNLGGNHQYLKIFSRSGSIHQHSRTQLRIDPEREEENEGVAGWAWYTDAQIIVRDLPEWPANPNPNHREDPVCQKYARMGLMSVDTVTRLKVKSRSIGATVVRDRVGKKWGVLALDSRQPQGVSDTPDKTDLLRLCADLINPHLGGS